jgi:ribosome maturation protein Sdo1
MPAEQLIYTPSPSDANAHPNTMVLLVDEEMYHKYQSDKSIALANVVQSFDVRKFANPGTTGVLETPSKAELEAAFGTTNSTEVVQFMLTHGQLKKTSTKQHHHHRKETPLHNATEAPRVDSTRRAY